MSTLGLALVLTAAICHATWNFIVKRIAAGPELVWAFSALATVLYAPVAIWVCVVQRPVFDGWMIVVMGVSAALHMAYFLLLQVAYRKGDLSLIYPVARATGPLLSASFAVLFLSEIMSAQMALGAGVVIGGILMLTGGKGRGATAAPPAVSVGFGMATGVLIASYTVWDAYAVAVLVIHPLLFDYITGAMRTVLTTPIAVRRWDGVRALWRDHRLAMLVIAVINPLAYILVLYAMTFTPVSYVAPVREVSVVLSVLAGSLILGEGRLKWRLGWAVVIVTGVALLATG